MIEILSIKLFPSSISSFLDIILAKTNQTNTKNLCVSATGAHG